MGVRACRVAHLITIVAASQLHFVANESAELAGRSRWAAWVCMGIQHHIALLSEPTVYSLYCGNVVFYVCSDLCGLLAAAGRFSILIGQYMQLTGCRGGGEMRGATSRASGFRLGGPAVHSLYCDCTVQR